MTATGPGRPPSWIWWVLVLLLGACAGFAATQGLQAERSAQAPDGWDRVGPRIPFRQAAGDASPPPIPDAWNLDHYESLWGQDRVESLTVTASVPDGAAQRILLCSLRKEGLEGPGVVIDRSTSPATVRGVRVTPRAQTNLKCEGDELPPPDDTPYTVTLERHAEKGRYTIRVGDAATTCRGAVPKDGPAIVGGLARTAVLAVVEDGRRQAPGFPPAGVPLGLLLGGLAWAGLCWTERRLGVSALWTVLSSLPLLLCLPLSSPDPERVAESLQLQSLASPWLALAAGVVPSLLWKGLIGVGLATRGRRGEAPLPRGLEPWAMALAPILPAAIGLALIPDDRARPQVLGLTIAAAGLGASGLVGGLRRGFGLDGPSALRATGALLGVFASAVLLTWLGGAGQREAAVCFGLAATTLGAVAVAREAGATRGPGTALSVLLVLGALGFLEGGVRHTSVADRWVDSADALTTQAAREALGSFDALAAAEPTTVPRRGFPVAVPPKGAAPRIVVLGGSEVAGGPWDDDPAAYFPSRLGARLGPGVEVVSQGVGDWTSLHMRLFAEAHLSSLAPDVVVVYAGRNDGVEALPLSLAELHRHWQVHGAGAEPSALAGLRLLQGARGLLTALLAPPLGPAVPVGDAAENLAALASTTRQAGARLLLVTQGLAPDPDRLAAYNTMLADLAAAQDGAALLDAGALLHDAGAGHFVDDRHLSTSGADLLAQALQERLAALGWVPAQPPVEPGE